MTPLAHGQLTVIAPPGWWPEAELPHDLRVEELDGVSCIGLMDDDPLWAGLAAMLQDCAIVPQVLTTVQTYPLAYDLVALGQGIAVVDPFTARGPSPARVQLRALDPPLPVRLYAVHAGDAPLRLRLRLDPRQWRWLWQFLAVCRHPVNQANSAHLLRLSLLSRQMLGQWQAEDGLVDFSWRDNGKLVVYRSAAGFSGAARQLLDPLKGYSLTLPLSGSHTAQTSASPTSNARRSTPGSANGCASPPWSTSSATIRPCPRCGSPACGASPAIPSPAPAPPGFT